MSRIKEHYFEIFANYDYIDMPSEDFELEYRMWQMKEDRLDRLERIFELLNA